jgi:hypothetical protein
MAAGKFGGFPFFVRFWRKKQPESSFCGLPGQQFYGSFNYRSIANQGPG